MNFSYQIPKYVLRFIVNRFDDKGNYKHKGLDYKEMRWLFRRGLVARILFADCFGLRGEAYDFRIACYWKKEFGLVTLTSK